MHKTEVKKKSFSNNFFKSTKSHKTWYLALKCIKLKWKKFKFEVFLIIIKSTKSH